METQQQKYMASRKREGLKPINVMIPIKDADKVKAYVKRLRKAAKLPLPQD